MINAHGGGVTTDRARTVRTAVRALHRAALSRALDGIILDRPTRPAPKATTAPLLRGRFAADPDAVDLAVDAAIREAAHTQLTHGWSPCELRTFAAPRLSALAVRYLVDAMGLAAQSSAAHEWFADLDAIGGRCWWTVGESHLTQWARRHGTARAQTIGVAVEVLALLSHLPCTESAQAESPAAARLEAGALVHDRRVAGRIDALFAKAARSVFPDEAAAYAAKAQDLLVRHARCATATTAVRRRPLPALRSA